MADAAAPGLGLVVLAAGAGTRLGGVAKALLSRPDGTSYLAAIVGTARAIGVATAIVVVGAPFGDAVAAEATRLGCVPVINPSPERGMASSVATGFAALAAQAPAACTAAWLWPVDHPAVRETTLAQLASRLGSHAAVRPTYDGRGGHPPLVARSLWPALAACTDAPGGARSVLAAAGTRDVAVDDAGVVRDVDTPADLEAR